MARRFMLNSTRKIGLLTTLGGAAFLLWKVIGGDSSDMSLFSALAWASAGAAIGLILGLAMLLRNQVRPLQSGPPAQLAVSPEDDTNLYRVLFENAGDAIFLMEGKKFIECNGMALTMFGCSRKEIIGQTPDRFSPPLQPDGELSAIKAGKKLDKAWSGQPIQFDWVHCRLDETVFEAQVSLNRFSMGGRQYVLAIVRDVTAQKRIAVALRESEERYRRIAESVTDYIYTVYIEDGKPSRTVHSPTCATVTGYAVADFTSRPMLWLDMIPDSDHPLVLAQINDILAGGKPDSAEHRIIREDSRVRWVRSLLVPYYDDTGTLRSYDGIVRDITESKEAEEALRESERRFRIAFRTNPESMTITRMSDGTLVEVNEGFTKITGYEAEEVLGKSTLDIGIWVAEKDRAEFVSRLQKDGYTKNLECAIRFKSGEIHPVLLSANIVNLDNEPHLLVAARDVTQWRDAADALRESEERFRTAFTMNPDSMSISRLDDGLIVEVNDGFVHTLGYSAEEAVNNTTISLGIWVDPNDRFRLVDSLRRDGKVENVEFQVRGKDGQTYPMLISAQTIDLQGVPHLIVIARDMTFWKEARRALVASEARFREIAEVLPEALFESDFEGILRFVNRTALEYFGFTREETERDFSIYDSIIPEERPRARDHMSQILSGQKPGAIEYTGLRKNGTRFPIMIHATTIYGNGQPVGVRGIVTDITDRKRMEADMARTEKLESLGLLAGGIAHDFNNILTGILANISLVRMDLEKYPEIDEQLSDAEKATVRAKDLTLQLLTFSKGGEPLKKSASLVDLVRDLAAFSLAGSNVTHELIAQDDVWPVDIDSTQIGQVVQNLVINADQAMPTGGRIVIVLSNIEVTDDLRLPLANDRYVRMTVSDTGIGIASENLPKIFDPYFTTKDTGSGLGLASTYSIIKRHQGHIEVNSEVGRGTTFTIYLPVGKQAASTAMSEDQPLERGSARVLIMDDEDFIRQLVVRILSKFGYNVDAAANGHEAVKMFQVASESGSPYDLVILDLTVPGGEGGREVIVEIRRIRPDTRAIVFSGYSNTPMAEFVRPQLFDAFICKPFKARALVQEVQNVLRSERSPVDVSR